jgi:hypothetical protein
VPEWIQYGWTTFFQSPNQVMPGVARPNWEQLAHFSFLKENKTINETNREVVLRAVVRDHHFRQALRTAEQIADLQKQKAPDEAKETELSKRLEKLQAQNQKEVRLARAMSWALTYYLANKKLDVLLNYRTELSRLPHELEFDEEVLEQCFTRALKGGKLADLAREWYDYMGGPEVRSDLPNFHDLMMEDLRAEARPPAPKKKEEPEKKY